MSCSTVRVWSDSGECQVLQAHKPAVWSLAGLYDVDGSRRILSCKSHLQLLVSLMYYYSSYNVTSSLCVKSAVG